MTRGILEKLRQKEMLHNAKLFFEARMDFLVGPVELNHMMQQGLQMNIIDVRRPEDFARGHIPGAVNLPEERWASFKGLSKDRPNIVYCYSLVCQLATKGARYFAEHDFPVMELQGGMEQWKIRSLPLEPTDES